jgi:hypothetical protein
MPSKEVAQLQHSSEFIQNQDLSVMRQTAVGKGVFYVSMQSDRVDFNLTESAVKVSR